MAGRSIVVDGKILGVDLDSAHRELRAHYRAGLKDRAGLQAALPALERVIAGHYAMRLGCC